MEERRKLPRKYLIAFSSVKDNQSGLHLGFLCDLNRDGLMIICKKPIDLGQETELYIELPEDKNFNKKYILIKTTAVWCEPDIDPRLYNTGFKITNLDKEEEQIIDKMIDLYEFRRDITPFPPSTAELGKIEYE